MNYLGVTYSIGAKPELDPGFIPFGVWMDAYLKDAKKPIAIAIERDRGQVSVRKTFIHGTPDMAKADYRYVSGWSSSCCGPSAASRSMSAAATISPSSSRPTIPRTASGPSTTTSSTSCMK